MSEKCCNWVGLVWLIVFYLLLTEFNCLSCDFPHRRCLVWSWGFCCIHERGRKQHQTQTLSRTWHKREHRSVFDLLSGNWHTQNQQIDTDGQTDRQNRQIGYLYFIFFLLSDCQYDDLFHSVLKSMFFWQTSYVNILSVQIVLFDTKMNYKDLLEVL